MYTCIRARFKKATLPLSPKLRQELKSESTCTLFLSDAHAAAASDLQIHVHVHVSIGTSTVISDTFVLSN